MSDKRQKETMEAGSPSRGKSRRKLLTAMMTGGAVAGAAGLPKKWTSPVVDSVLLPAHAQTSGDLSDPCQLNVEVTGAGDSAQVTVTVSGTVTGPGDVSGITMNILFELLMNNSVVDSDTENDDTNAGGNYSASTTFSGICAEGANGVRVTVTSDDPRLAGETAGCEDSFSKNCDPV